MLVDPAIGELGDVDSAAVVLTTKSGRIAQISNTRRASYGYDQRIEVLGEKGLVSADNLRATNVEIANGDGYRREPLLNFFMTRYTEAYRAEIAAFIATIAAGKPASPTGEDGPARWCLPMRRCVPSARSAPSKSTCEGSRRRFRAGGGFTLLSPRARRAASRRLRPGPATVGADMR